jgi:hypothetical protein
MKLKDSLKRISRNIAWKILVSTETKEPFQYNLNGDRAIEWSWVIAHLPKSPSQIFDFGSTGSILSATASRLGHSVTSIDQLEIEYDMPNLDFIKGNILEVNLEKNKYDVIMNCSTVEHVGLAGRYGSKSNQNGDLESMSILADLVNKTGNMILTIPVGQDDCFEPFHRVYGRKRLPLLLEKFEIIEEEYWNKSKETMRWCKVTRDEALQVKGNEKYYALGLFLLTKKPLELYAK